MSVETSVPIFRLTRPPPRLCVFVSAGLGPLVDGCVPTIAARANNGEQLALADGFGRVRLLRYPAVNDDQVARLLTRVHRRKWSSSLICFMPWHCQRSQPQQHQ